MAHKRIRTFNTKETYPEQNLDNDLCQAVVARGTTVFLRGQCPQNLDDAKKADTTPVQSGSEAISPNPPAQPPQTDRPESTQPLANDDDVEAQNERYDKAFYLDMASRLTQARHISKVHQLFEEMKPKIQEIKKRSPERAKHILELFMKHEDRLSNGES